MTCGELRRQLVRSLIKWGLTMLMVMCVVLAVGSGVPIRDLSTVATLVACAVLVTAPAYLIHQRMK